MVNLKLAAAALAAGAALTGCIHAVEPTTHLANAPADSQWVDAASRTWRTDLPLRPEVPPVPSGGIAPGMELGQRDTAGGIWRCSAGAEATDPQGHPVMIATGHCDVNRGVPVTTADGTPVGVYADSRVGHTDIDSYVSQLRLNPGVQPASGASLGGWPVDGVLIARTAEVLPRGTSVCMAGYKIGGVACGKLDLGMKDQLWVKVTGAAPGDSSGPAWIVDSNGRAVYVGVILEGPKHPIGESSITIASAEPYMREHGLEIARG